MTSPDNSTGTQPNTGWSDVSEMATDFTQQGLIGILFNGFANGLIGFISSLVGGIFGGSGGGLGDLIGGFLGVKNQVDSHNGQIIDLGNQVGNQGQRLDDLESFAGTGVTTALYDSIGGRDFVTFPDSQMMPVPANSTGNNNLGQHRHVRDGTGNFTGYENLGNHNHSQQTTVPAFNQQVSTNVGGGTPNGTIDFGLLRGGFDGEIPIEMLRLITGGDNSPFGIDAWYIGIYVADIPNERFAKIWDPGNIRDTLANQRQRYNLATGLTSKAQNDQILAVATLQIAPGALQNARGIGCIFQTGISEPAGTFPQARAARLPTQTSLPQYVPFSSLTWDKERLLWAGLGPLPS